jgi:hypothetical protein
VADTSPAPLFDISLAEGRFTALRAGEIDHLDFARVAREKLTSRPSSM